MSPSTSHDPKTDHRSLYILVTMLVVVAIAGIMLLGYIASFPAPKDQPVKLYTIDGCDLYRFTDGKETGYFARCQNGNASTSVGDQHVLTTPKAK